VQLKAAAAALATLETFENDPEIIRAAIMLLGWTLSGGPAKDKVQLFVEQSSLALPLLQQYMERFRLDSTIINSTTFVRRALTAGAVPPPPVLVPPPDWDEDEKKNNDDDDDGVLLTDSEDEEDKSGKAAEEKGKGVRHNLKDTRKAIGSFLYFTMGRTTEEIDRETAEAAALYAAPTPVPTPSDSKHNGKK
jgi:hypothetical protein